MNGPEPMAKNRPLQVWNVMEIQRLRFDWESMDTACWLVVRMLAACCAIMKTLCIIIYTVHACNFPNPSVS
jgi:hypothetical protein